MPLKVCVGAHVYFCNPWSHAIENFLLKKKKELIKVDAKINRDNNQRISQGETFFFSC